MPTVPLIFVEVALVDKMSDSIAPLLDETAAASDLGRATTAIFYPSATPRPACAA